MHCIYEAAKRIGSLDWQLFSRQTPEGRIVETLDIPVDRPKWMTEFVAELDQQEGFRRELWQHVRRLQRPVRRSRTHAFRDRQRRFRRDHGSLRCNPACPEDRQVVRCGLRRISEIGGLEAVDPQALWIADVDGSAMDGRHSGGDRHRGGDEPRRDRVLRLNVAERNDARASPGTAAAGFAMVAVMRSLLSQPREPT